MAGWPADPSLSTDDRRRLVLSPAVRDVLQETPTANDGGNWTLDDTETATSGSLNRVIEQDDPLGGKTTLAYDTAGRLTSCWAGWMGRGGARSRAR